MQINLTGLTDIVAGNTGGRTGVFIHQGSCVVKELVSADFWEGGPTTYTIRPFLSHS